MANTQPTKKQRPSAADDATADILRLVDGFLGLVWQHFFARIAEFRLSAPEAKALKFLAADRSITMRELAAKLHSNPSNVTVVVGKLEAHGLVRRTGAEDRRIKGVQLTSEGLELCRKLKARLEADHPAVSRLSAAQRETLRKILREIVEG
jgi:DNA-binding MarR family transcriptional regulator